jgi:outer membrane lipoprotein LolB
MKTSNFFPIFYVFLLTSCATHQLTTNTATESPPTDSEVQLRADSHQKIKANTLSSWTISGAMAAKNNKNKGWSASLNWKQFGLNNYQIRLSGPLGGGTVLINKSGGVVTYTDGPKKVSSANADLLLLQQTGIQLPVNNLYYWVRGLPAPGKIESAHFDSHQNLSSLTQSGYTIDYAKYTTVDNLSLPAKIRLQGHGVLIKLIIKHWSV